MENERRKLVENLSYNINVKSIKEEIEHCADVFCITPHSAYKYAEKNHAKIIRQQEQEGMEGIFAVPSIVSISGIRDGNVISLWDEYHLACVRMKMILQEELALNDLTNSNDNNDGRPRIWKLESDAVRARWRADDVQRGQDIILISAQLGREYVDCSHNCASLKMFSNGRGEFPLDFCSFGAILLLHPERMKSEDSLIADMFGTRISIKNKFGIGNDRIPLLQRFCGKLTLSTYPTDDHSYRCGIPSGIIM